MSEFLNSEVAQTGGWLTVSASIGLTFVEWLRLIPVNDILQGVMLVGSIVFLYYKIKNARLDAKIKKQKILDNQNK